jgi:hypothetical protein
MTEGTKKARVFVCNISFSSHMLERKSGAYSYGAYDDVQLLGKPNTPSCKHRTSQKKIFMDKRCSFSWSIDEKSFKTLTPKMIVSWNLKCQDPGN